LPCQNINFFERKFDAFFCREDPNPTGIRRLGVMVKFQGTDHEIVRYAMETLTGPSRLSVRRPRERIFAFVE
jgi:hypothetical protein